MEILIKKINEGAKLPVYASEAASGIDLYTLDEVIIEAGTTVDISTGIAMAVPVGYVGLVWNQHGMMAKEAIKILPSMVDSSYRGEIMVQVTNTGGEAHTFSAGAKIAQILIQRIHRSNLIEVEDLSL